MDTSATSCDPSAPEDLGFTSTETWRRLSEGHPFPLSAAYELTHRCDLHCPHCYVAPSQRGDELTTAEALGVLDQMAEMGVLVLAVTGGEPTVRRDFMEILRGALDRRFVVVLKTNAASLGDDEVRRMADWGLFELNASLYHTDSRQHDRFVGRAGAWEGTVAALRAFRGAGRNVRVSIMAMGWNLDAVIALEQMCESEGWRHAVDFRIEPRNDGSLEPARHRADANGLVDLVSRSAFLRRRLRPRADGASSAGPMMCGADTGLVIQPDGTVIPCVSLAGFRLGNVRDNKLAEIWRDSAERRAGLRLRWGDQPRCSGCDLLADCRRCPATGYIEHGDFTTPSALDCELAAVWREARLRLQRDGR